MKRSISCLFCNRHRSLSIRFVPRLTKESAAITDEPFSPPGFSRAGFFQRGADPSRQERGQVMLRNLADATCGLRQQLPQNPFPQALSVAVYGNFRERMTIFHAFSPARVETGGC